MGITEGDLCHSEVFDCPQEEHQLVSMLGQAAIIAFTMIVRVFSLERLHDGDSKLSCPLVGIVAIQDFENMGVDPK
jgi:hypothetical protein